MRKREIPAGTGTVRKKDKLLSVFFLLGSGVLTGLCVAYPALGILQWFSMVPGIAVFFRLAERERLRAGALWRSGFCWFYSYYLVIFSFFWYMYPLDFVGLQPKEGLAVILVAWLGLSLLQTLVGAFVPLLFALCVRTPLCRRKPLVSVFLLAAVWAVREWGQTHFWTGVPFGRLPVGQTAYPVMIQTASLFGSYFVTFLLVAVNGLLAFALLYADRRRFYAGLAAGIVGLQATAGILLSRITDRSAAAGEQITVAAIQGNVSSADKWRKNAGESFAYYCELTKEAAEKGAKLIVWPETAYPAPFSADSNNARKIGALAKEYQVTVLIGTFVRKTEGVVTKQYNAICVVLPDGTLSETVYAKRHLVPFGEYVPMRAFFTVVFPPLANVSILASDVTPGDDPAVAETAAGKIGSLICFDSIYEELALDAVRNGAEILAVSTNDSWFFDSPAITIHNAQSILRAVETGRWVVRAANTGVSSVISPAGQVQDSLPALEQGILYGTVTRQTGTTPYTRLGNAFVYLCIAFVLFFAGGGVCTALGRKRTARRAAKNMTATEPTVKTVPEIKNKKET